MKDEQESVPLIDPGPPSESREPQTNEYHTYKTRWYVLSVFTAITSIFNLALNVWSPISEACKIMFGWKNWQVILLKVISASCVLLTAFPSIWIMEKKGLRSSVILCTFLLTAGKALQVIPCSDTLTRTVLLNVGDCIALLSSAVALGAPPFISATWFPPNERTTATAISSLVGNLGLAAGFIVGPNMVPIERQLNPSVDDNINSSVTRHDVYNSGTMKNNFNKYIEVQLGISALLLVCVLVYFPDKPSMPPCATASKEQHDFMENVKKLIVHRSYLYLGLLFSLCFAGYLTWLSVLSLAVKPFGIDGSLAAWIGTAAVIAGTCSGVCIGRVVDYAKRRIKAVLIGLFFCTTISQLSFTLTCSRIIPFSKPLLFSSIILGGLFFNATIPLMIEMAVEIVYPIAEGVTSILLFALANIWFLIFYVLFMFSFMDITWSNWVSVISNAICVPGLMVFKVNFKRQELE